MTIASVLKAGHVEPNALENGDAPNIGGYRLMLWMLGAIWVIGLFALIFWPKTKSETELEAQATPVTLADRLRPYIDSAVKGDLPEESQAELERLLLAYWHEKLDVGDLSAVYYRMKVAPR